MKNYILELLEIIRGIIKFINGVLIFGFIGGMFSSVDSDYFLFCILFLGIGTVLYLLTVYTTGKISGAI
jgi:hypothetical protein